MYNGRNRFSTGVVSIRNSDVWIPDDINTMGTRRIKRVRWQYSKYRLTRNPLNIIE